MTEQQLNRLCKSWQRRVPMFAHYSVTVRLEKTRPGTDALVAYFTDRDSAVIRIDPTAAEDQELLLLHELCHLGLDSAIEAGDTEKVIWLTARSLLSARGRR